MLKRETGILASLDHPNIIKLYECYEDSKYYHLVMEFCSGPMLLDKLLDAHNFNEAETSKMMKKIISAVMSLHAQGIAHRDLKPDNFVYENDDSNAEIKLIDFGLANKFEHDRSFETVIGTPKYLAPEVLKGKYGP